MAKRWELELETGRVAPEKHLGKAKQLQESLEKDIDKNPISLEKDEKPSALANKLLALWAQGMLSAALIREIAHLALQDGAQHNDLVALARTGNWEPSLEMPTGKSSITSARTSCCQKATRSR